MSDWKPSLYLTFEKERTQPAIDLVMRIDNENPTRIIDIGCGPGNSTNILKTRWTHAEIFGLDSSQAMIDEAKRTYKDISWICIDASNDLTEMGKFDVIFSNAAIQWIPNQDRLLKDWFSLLNRNGSMAVQVPNTENMPVHTELKNLASTEKWKRHFASLTHTYSIHAADFYYNILCGLTDSIDLWVTNYHHVMSSHCDIAKWYSSTGLRPYFDCLQNDSLITDFKNDFEVCLKKVYPLQSNGKILFPFTRIFFIAKKTDTYK